MQRHLGLWLKFKLREDSVSFSDHELENEQVFFFFPHWSCQLKTSLFICGEGWAFGPGAVLTEQCQAPATVQLLFYFVCFFFNIGYK